MTLPLFGSFPDQPASTRTDANGKPTASVMLGGIVYTSGAALAPVAAGVLLH